MIRRGLKYKCRAINEPSSSSLGCRLCRLAVAQPHMVTMAHERGGGRLDERGEAEMRGVGEAVIGDVTAIESLNHSTHRVTVTGSLRVQQ